MGQDDTLKWVHEEKGGSDEDPNVTRVHKGEVESPGILQLTKVGSEGEKEATIETVDIPFVELEGEPFNPFESFSVLALVDAAQIVKKIRKIPAFMHINRPVTILGNSKRADFKVDDFETVRPEHSAVVFRNGCFHIFPREGSVNVNGNEISEEGQILRNGTQIKMGSATFLFLTVLK
ncbi:MAG: FHA domain-containing protein [Gemmatimonadota bacterium]|nr:MAG: FHA domain-containing protein [Gemmatimonadota bacterium]